MYSATFLEEKKKNSEYIYYFKLLFLLREARSSRGKAIMTRRKKLVKPNVNKFNIFVLTENDVSDFSMKENWKFHKMIRLYSYIII